MQQIIHSHFTVPSGHNLYGEIGKLFLAKRCWASPGPSSRIDYMTQGSTVWWKAPSIICKEPQAWSADACTSTVCSHHLLQFARVPWFLLPPLCIHAQPCPCAQDWGWTATGDVIKAPEPHHILRLSIQSLLPSDVCVGPHLLLECLSPLTYPSGFNSSMATLLLLVGLGFLCLSSLHPGHLHCNAGHPEQQVAVGLCISPTVMWTTWPKSPCSLSSRSKTVLNT